MSGLCWFSQPLLLSNINCCPCVHKLVIWYGSHQSMVVCFYLLSARGSWWTSSFAWAWDIFLKVRCECSATFLWYLVSICSTLSSFMEEVPFTFHWLSVCLLIPLACLVHFINLHFWSQSFSLFSECSNCRVFVCSCRSISISISHKPGFRIMTFLE